MMNDVYVYCGIIRFNPPVNMSDISAKVIDYNLIPNCALYGKHEKGLFDSDATSHFGSVSLVDSYIWKNVPVNEKTLIKSLETLK